MLVGLHVPTNFQMYRQNSEKALLGGGGSLATLMAGNAKEADYNDLGNLRAKRAANLKILVCLVVFLC